MTGNYICLSRYTILHLGVISTIEFHVKDEGISSDGVAVRVRCRSDTQSQRAIKPVKLNGKPSIPASTEWRGKWDFNLSHLIKLSFSLIPRASLTHLVWSATWSAAVWMPIFLLVCLFKKTGQYKGLFLSLTLLSEISILGRYVMAKVKFGQHVEKDTQLATKIYI